MPAEQSDGFNLDDRDRLPWLEPAGIEADVEPVSPLRILGLVLVGLLLLALIIGGGYWLKHRGGAGADGEVQLIPAQNGSYKIPANASDSKAFEGENDETFQASAGGEAGGRIDPSRVPEAPRTDLRPAAGSGAGAPATPPPAAKPTVSATVRETTAAPPSARPAAAGTAGPAGSRIQVGAYNSEQIAQGVWRRLSGQFDYLKDQEHSVEPVQTGGRTLYRLRVSLGSAADASAACGKLRVAGENCMVVR